MSAHDVRIVDPTIPNLKQRCKSYPKDNAPDAFISIDIADGWTIRSVVDCLERVLVFMERWE